MGARTWQNMGQKDFFRLPRTEMHGYSRCRRRVTGGGSLFLSNFSEASQKKSDPPKTLYFLEKNLVKIKELPKYSA